MTARHKQPGAGWRKSATAEVTQVRVCLVKREMCMADLAGCIGMKAHALHVQSLRGMPSLKTRLQIEDYLGIPIWHSHAQFKRHAEQKKLWGFLPLTWTTRALRAQARTWGVPGASGLHNKADLISATEGWLRSKQPTPKPRP